MKIKRIQNNVCLRRVAVLCDTEEKSNALLNYFQINPYMGAVTLTFKDNPWAVYKENTCYGFYGNNNIGVMHKNTISSTGFTFKEFDEVFDVENAETAEEAYKRGLNDMYSVIHAICSDDNDVKITADDYIACFGYGTPFKAISLKYSDEEIVNALNEYFKAKTIKPSDEVFCFADAGEEWRQNDEHYGVVLDVANDTYTVLMKNGDVVEFQKNVLEKTGRTIPIKSVLDAIRAK